MDTVYHLKVNKSLEFTLTSNEILEADIINTSAKTYHLLQDNTSFLAEIKDANFHTKTYTVKINNNTYEVAIQNQLDLLIKEMGLSHKKTTLVNQITSPMPGLILTIDVVVGQEVKENDSLLILEAMKMENSISSPRDGVIKNITVSQGEAIEKGAVLIEFE